MCEPKEGWGNPLTSKKWHYFSQGRSLCGRWAFWGELIIGHDDSPDNCTACKKRLAKEKATEAAGETDDN